MRQHWRPQRQRNGIRLGLEVPAPQAVDRGTAGGEVEGGGQVLTRGGRGEASVVGGR